MNEEELEYFDRSYRWYSDFLSVRKEALHAMRRLGFSYQEMQDTLNFNHPCQAEMILAGTVSDYEEKQSDN